ncbi:MAG: DHA2 family efflux MFS transporter permease subunit [Acidimicrobiia bacterium]|nr:DHA2 family efflux MFS transporter permease subunit [Acidimicrobiia bacterium]
MEDVVEGPGLRLSSAAGRWVVAGMVLGSAVTYLAATVVNVALPSIAQDLDADLAGLQWVTNGYLLTLASLVLVGGSAGDIFGRRAVFLIGLATFAAATVLCALAPGLGVLVAGRLLQGLGAALMTPASLAIIDASFHPEDQSRAIAAWASGSALASSTGPFVGGWAVDQLSWRWVFFLILPFAAATAVAVVRHVPESRARASGRHLDLTGAALACVAVAGVVFALVEGPGRGWSSPLVLASGVVGVVAAALFVGSQRRHRDPMLPLRLFEVAQFSGANGATLLIYFAISGAFFFTALQFQTVVGYSALAAGAALVPMNVVMIVGSPRAGALAAAYGPRWLVTAGPLVLGAGLVWLSRVDAGADYVTDVLPPVLLVGVGLTTMVAPLTASVLAAVTPDDVGIGSAVNNAVARTGSLLATAVLPFAAGLSGDVTPEALSSGYRRALLVCAGLCAAGAAIAAATIGRCVELHTTQQASPTSGCGQRSLPARADEGA